MGYLEPRWALHGLIHQETQQVRIRFRDTRKYHRLRKRDRLLGRLVKVPGTKSWFGPWAPRVNRLVWAAGWTYAEAVERLKDGNIGGRDNPKRLQLRRIMRGERMPTLQMMEKVQRFEVAFAEDLRALERGLIRVKCHKGVLWREDLRIQPGPQPEDQPKDRGLEVPRRVWAQPKAPPEEGHLKKVQHSSRRVIVRRWQFWHTQLRLREVPVEHIPTYKLIHEDMCQKLLWLGVDSRKIRKLDLDCPLRSPEEREEVLEECIRCKG